MANFPPKSQVIVVGLCVLFGLLIHFLPNFKVPLSSDVTWNFRLQVSQDQMLESAIPKGFEIIGAYPKPMLMSVMNWLDLTGRFNIVDLVTLRGMAYFASDNADLWRLIQILSLSLAAGLFCLIMAGLNINWKIILPLVLGLFFSPIDVWVDQKSAEPRGILFLMLAYFLALKSRNLFLASISALSMFLSVLIKETFLFAWMMIPALILWPWKIQGRFAQKDLVRLKSLLIPHFLAFIILVAFILYLKLSKRMDNPGYVVQNIENNLTIFSYWVKYLPVLLPGFFSGFWAKLLIFCVFITLISFLLKLISNLKISSQKFLKLKFLILFLSLAVTIFFSVNIYFWTNRNFEGRYILPSNFLIAILFGFILQLVTSSLIFKLKVNRSAIYLMYFTIVFILLVVNIDRLINYSVQNHIDQSEWQRFIDSVKTRAPQNAHVLLLFEEPFMIETAQSLEANTLLSGRYDLTYHLTIEDQSIYQKDSGYLLYLVNLFNLYREESPESGKTLYVKASRVGVNSKLDNISFIDIKLLFSNPKEFFNKRYVLNKMPYLNYQFY